MTEREKALELALSVHDKYYCDVCHEGPGGCNEVEDLADAILEAKAQEAERPTGLTILDRPVITNEQLLRAAKLRSQILEKGEQSTASNQQQ